MRVINLLILSAIMFFALSCGSSNDSSNADEQKKTEEQKQAEEQKDVAQNSKNKKKKEANDDFGNFLSRVKAVAEAAGDSTAASNVAQMQELGITEDLGSITSLLGDKNDDLLSGALEKVAAEAMKGDAGKQFKEVFKGFTQPADSGEANPFTTFTAMKKMGDRIKKEAEEDKKKKEERPHITYDFDKLEVSDYKMKDLINEIKAIDNVEKSYTLNSLQMILLPIFEKKDREIRVTMSADIFKEEDKYVLVFTDFNVKKSDNIKGKITPPELGKKYPNGKIIKDRVLEYLYKLDQNAIFKKNDSLDVDRKPESGYTARLELNGSKFDLNVAYKDGKLINIYTTLPKMSHEEGAKESAYSCWFSGKGSNLLLDSLTSMSLSKNGSPVMKLETYKFKY